ncbi:unnamed protein product [Brassicogethes aeneus]|uniref:BZIP domain-containing protein n=1 Tax=Brassicogethes aeneus TaxID=1431903 RepID=A0A9P0FJP3_BRAAE|nr:unnamed protein product [Brassicogethes aeneus]
MYNLNINLAQTAAAAASNLLVESTCTTPRTPEILNSIVAMTNPLDTAFGCSANQSPNNRVPSGPLTNLSSDSNSSHSSQVESPTTNNPPSVQHTCSQLIKAGLKLSIEQKRKHQSSDGEDLLDMDKIKRIKRTESESDDDKFKHEHGMQNENGIWYQYDVDCLTPEDEERRRRRRERNKIAATKCRLKKRERTALLMTEAETLESQNVDFKSQLADLHKQKNHLLGVLDRHRPHCHHNIPPATRDSLYKLPPVSSVMENHSYSRPASGDSSYHPNYYNNCRPDNNMNNYQRNTLTTYQKTPSIIVEEISDNFESHFTDLDDYSFNQCHNYASGQGYGTSGLDNGCMA